MSEFKDDINDFLESTKDKIKNPFAFTFVVAWILNNWKLLYTFFTVDQSLGLSDRIDLIEKNFSFSSNWRNLTIFPLLEAVAVIAIFLIFKHVTYVLVTWFTSRIKPWINSWKWIRSQRNVDRSEFDRKVKELNRIQAELDRLYEVNREYLLEKQKLLKEKDDEKTRSVDLLNQHIEELGKKLEHNTVHLNKSQELANNLKLQIDALNESKNKLQVELSEKTFELKTAKDSLPHITNDLASIFGNSMWTNSYSKENANGEEPFKFLNDTFQLENGSQIRIKDIRIDLTNNTVSFTKHFIDNSEIKDTLVLVNNNLLVGVEGDGISIQYERKPSRVPKNFRFNE